jgi:peptidoglycan L-alanyl-D-glutamate endopeptidase CwlK
MTQYKLSTRSLQSLSGVHPDLVAVVEAAIKITKQDFIVIEGIRSVNRQRELLKAGKSTTMKSRHITGHAVDVCPNPVDWNDTKKFHAIADAIKQAAKELKVSIEWGGDWKTFVDMPHFQLPQKDYPA